MLGRSNELCFKPGFHLAPPGHRQRVVVLRLSSSDKCSQKIDHLSMRSRKFSGLGGVIDGL